MVWVAAAAVYVTFVDVDHGHGSQRIDLSRTADMVAAKITAITRPTIPTGR